jgi:hypothetical protein
VLKKSCLGDLISIQISALLVLNLVYRSSVLPGIREEAGCVGCHKTSTGIRFKNVVFLNVFTVRSTARTLITYKNDHSAFLAIKRGPRPGGGACGVLNLTHPAGSLFP